MVITKGDCKASAKQGKKKLYYISAEFLIGKLLSNNLINLGIFEDVRKCWLLMEEDWKRLRRWRWSRPLEMAVLEDLPSGFHHPTLGLPGDGIGLNYHFGLFRQMLADNKQKEVKNPWITSESWLVRQPVTFTVPFKGF